MLKSISAVLVAASMLAAPAMAASKPKTDSAAAPVAQTTVGTPTNAKFATGKIAAGRTLNAKASMHEGRHHRHHAHYRSHKHMSFVKKHAASHVVKSRAGIKHLSAAKMLSAKTRG